MSGNWKSGLFILHMMTYDIKNKTYNLTLTEEQYKRWERSIKSEQLDEDKLRAVLGDLLAKRYIPECQVTEDNIESYLKGE